MSQYSEPEGASSVVELVPALRVLLQMLWAARPSFFVALLVLTVLEGAVTPLSLPLNASLLALVVGGFSARQVSPDLILDALRVLGLLAGLQLAGQLVAYVQ